jgi:hypothetical protein
MRLPALESPRRSSRGKRLGVGSAAASFLLYTDLSCPRLYTSLIVRLIILFSSFSRK